MFVEDEFVREDLGRLEAKKEIRSSCVLARFHDGVAAGWAFRVPVSMAGALDIQRSVVRRAGREFSSWTQGRAFNVSLGTTLTHAELDLKVQVDDSEPAGSLDRLGGYSPGRVSFSVYVLQDGGWAKAAEYLCTQVEFIGMLQVGELVTRAGVIDVVKAHSLSAGSELLDVPRERGEPVSLSQALKFYDVDVSAVVAGTVLIGAGILREVSRWSTSREEEKRYKVFTGAGEYFGFDRTTRGAPESQPMYYLNRFAAIADLIRRFMAGEAGLSVWAPSGSASIEANGAVVGLYCRSPLGTEEWYSRRVAEFRERFGVPVANMLHLVKAQEEAGSSILEFWEFSEGHELLSRYHVVVDSSLDQLSAADVEYRRQKVSWN